MFKDTKAFSSFSTNDLEASKKFYGETLGVVVHEEPNMGLRLELNGTQVFLYPKDNHVPASFTVLNFKVDDIDTAVDELVEKGVVFEEYSMEEMPQDNKGIFRGLVSENGPDIAWFTDPAGNIVALMQEGK